VKLKTVLRNMLIAAALHKIQARNLGKSNVLLGENKLISHFFRGYNYYKLIMSSL